jgi:hypothetical protein
LDEAFAFEASVKGNTYKQEACPNEASYNKVAKRAIALVGHQSKAKTEHCAYAE